MTVIHFVKDDIEVLRNVKRWQMDKMLDCGTGWLFFGYEQVGDQFIVESCDFEGAQSMTEKQFVELIGDEAAEAIGLI